MFSSAHVRLPYNIRPEKPHMQFYDSQFLQKVKIYCWGAIIDIKSYAAICLQKVVCKINQKCTKN